MSSKTNKKSENELVELSNIIKDYETTTQSFTLVSFLKHVGHLLEQDSIATQKKQQHSTTKTQAFNNKVEDILVMLPHVQIGLIQKVLEFTHEDTEFAVDLLLNHSSEELVAMIKEHSQIQLPTTPISPLYEMVELYSMNEMKQVVSLEEEYFQQLQLLEELISEKKYYNTETNEISQHEPYSPSTDNISSKIQFERMLLQKRIRDESLRKNTRFYCQDEFKVLKGKQQRRYNLQPSFFFDMTGEELHFHIAASQFYRFLANKQLYGVNQRYRVENVEYIVSPEFVSKFNAKKIELAKKHGFLVESMKPVLLFHGTSETNMENILKTNFLISKVGSSTDMGYYGKGIYFSEFPGLSIGYSRGNPYLLVCLVLVGKAYKMNNVVTGCALEKGYDSHTSPDGSEVVIFDMDCIIPMYKLKWKME